jgi:predicted anti-sigma-YlaC factor YlaD
VAGFGGVTCTVAGGGGTISGGALDVGEEADVEGATAALALRAADSALTARLRLGVTAAALSRPGVADA